MENLNWGYLQLGLVALAFGGLQVWWIGSVFWKRKLARPPERGVIIALEEDQKIRLAVKVAPNIDFYRYEVKFDLKKV